MGCTLVGEPTGKTGLVGIARLAAQSPLVRERAEVEYYRLAARSTLNRESSGRMPFAWTINPYRGCEFGCKYCYARYTHEFMELWDGRDFERKIYAKVDAPELLRAELRQARDKGLPIALGTATDPYQPAEEALSNHPANARGVCRICGAGFFPHHEIGLDRARSGLARDHHLPAPFQRAHDGHHARRAPRASSNPRPRRPPSAWKPCELGPRRHPRGRERHAHPAGIK